MGDKEYTLDELVRLTGFSKRQIRYYITKKLVPGAGDQLGPYAVYGEETLQRLRMIKVLKAQPYGPAGRTMTLAEIKHSLDNKPESHLSLMALREQEFEIRNDPMEFREEPKSSASSYLEDIEEEDLSSNEPSISNSRYMILGNEVSNIPALFDPADENPLDDLMQSLRSLLFELGSDTLFESQTSEGDSWRRITSPDVEIQVRTPDTMEARKRLLRMALQISHLLAREE